MLPSLTTKLKLTWKLMSHLKLLKKTSCYS